MQPLCPPDDGQREQFWDEDVVTATTTGPSLSQSWRAGDVVENVYASGDPYMNRWFAHVRNYKWSMQLSPQSSQPHNSSFLTINFTAKFQREHRQRGRRMREG